MIMGIEKYVGEFIAKIGVNKAKKKSNILKEALDKPDCVKLEAWIEDDEIIIRIRKKDETN